MPNAADPPPNEKPDVGGKRFRVRRISQQPLDTMGYQGFDTREDAIQWAEKAWAMNDLVNVLVSERAMVDGREVWVVIWSLPLI